MSVVKIEVTQDDIERGERCNSAKCPVARAVQRATGLIARVRMDRVDFVRRRVPLPPVVADFVRDYDIRQPVEPFTFELEV